MSKKLNRLEFMKMLGLGSTAALLSSCAPSVMQEPTNQIPEEPVTDSSEIQEATNQTPENPVTGYMLIRTEYTNDEGTVVSTPPDSFDTANIVIADQINTIVSEFTDFVRGAIVKFDNKSYGIVISLQTKTMGDFDEIIRRIREIEPVTLNSQGSISEVTKAVDSGLPTGFEGLP
jgi:hypothetical protein